MGVGMIAAALARHLPKTALGKLGIGVLVALIVGVVAFVGGYRFAGLQDDARLAAQLQDAIAARDAAEARADVEAKRYLAASQDRRVIYREVIKRVPQIINTGGCNLTPDGLHAVNCTLDPSSCGTAGALPAPDNADRP